MSEFNSRDDITCSIKERRVWNVDFDSGLTLDVISDNFDVPF